MRHVGIFGISNTKRINRVAVIDRQRLGMAEYGQYRVDPHLLGCEIIELLGTCLNSGKKQGQDYVYVAHIRLILLFTIEFEHLAVFYISLKMIIDMYGTYSCRRSGVEDITGL